ncbi:hypothetical protein PFISCL1PPCAC_10157, partial [Pristionchus fissidentatus]
VRYQAANMNSDEHDDPDSGHPTPRDNFDTSTPIRSHGRERRRPSLLVPEPFSPVGSSRFSNSSRHNNTHSNDFKVVNGIIDIVKNNVRLEEEVEEMKNESMRVEQDLEDKDATIAELTEELNKIRTVNVHATIDLRKMEGEQADASTQHDEGLREAERKWEEERREMIERLEEMERELEEEMKNGEELKEWKKKYESLETEKELIMKRAGTTVERNETLIREKEEKMKEEMEKKEKELRDMEEKMIVNESTVAEGNRRMKEFEDEMELLKEQKKNLEGILIEYEETKKERATLRERLAATEEAMRRVNSENLNVRDLERKIREIEKKSTVIEQDLIDARRHYDELKKIREEEMTEGLEMKTKIDQQQSELDRLRKVNDELSVRNVDGDKTKEELEARVGEGRRMEEEMKELRRELERRRDKQKRLEDELDIARKMSEDATREMLGMREEREKEKKEREKEKEEGRLEWMDKDLRETNELRKTMEREKEQSEIRVRDALEAVNRQQQVYEELKLDFEHFKASAQDQYVTDIAAKDEELSAIRDRLAQFESYPGKFVSVDDRYSEGRSVFDLLPTQMKEYLEICTNGQVIRGVDRCKNMIIRGNVGMEREEVAPPPPPAAPSLSHLPLIESLSTCEVHSSNVKHLLDVIVRILEELDGEGITLEIVSSIGDRLSEELMDIDDRVKEMERRNGEIGERLRLSQEERRKIEGEIIRADGDRKRALEEMKELRVALTKACSDRDEAKEKAKTFENAATEYAELHAEVTSELNDSEEDLKACEAKCARIERESSEKDRKIKMLKEEYDDVERKLEEEIARNSSLSIKLVTHTSEVQGLEKEVKRATSEAERYKRKKEKAHGFVWEVLAGLKRHLEVYGRVKSRNMQRQQLLNMCMDQIDETKRAIGGSARLDKLQQTLYTEISQLSSDDVVDEKSSREIRRELDEITNDQENM